MKPCSHKQPGRRDEMTKATQASGGRMERREGPAGGLPQCSPSLRGQQGSHGAGARGWRTEPASAADDGGCAARNTSARLLQCRGGAACSPQCLQNATSKEKPLRNEKPLEFTSCLETPPRAFPTSPGLVSSLPAKRRSLSHVFCSLGTSTG